MDIQFPPFLQKGDKVVIVSPSSKIDQQFLKGAKKRTQTSYNCNSRNRINIGHLICCTYKFRSSFFITTFT